MRRTMSWRSAVHVAAGSALIASSVAAVGVLVTGVLQPWGIAPVQAMVPAILDYEFAAG